MSELVKVEGLQNITAEINRRVRKVGAYNRKAMTDIVFDCLGGSVERAPVDTGDLRGSGFAQVNGAEVAHVGDMRTKGDKLQESKKAGKTHRTAASGATKDAAGYSENNIVGVVGFSAAYALKQHEDLTLSHPNGGEAKYLEKTLVENTEKYIDHLAKSVGKAIK